MTSASESSTTWICPVCGGESAARAPECWQCLWTPPPAPRAGGPVAWDELSRADAASAWRLFEELGRCVLAIRRLRDRAARTGSPVAELAATLCLDSYRGLREVGRAMNALASSHRDEQVRDYTAEQIAALTREREAEAPIR